MNKKSELIVALDVETLQEAKDLVGSLGKLVNIFKVGSQLFTACGPEAVRYIIGRGKKVFLDLKYHDIPNTVAYSTSGAVIMSKINTSANVNTGLFMYTIHTMGGLAMMRAAVDASTKKAQEIGVARPLAVGVTVLTSEENQDNILPLVLKKAKEAKEAGLDGVVASVQEAGVIRRELGKDFVIVTPGIRPTGEEVGDQRRIATPREAVLAGSNYLVVGRPILKAVDPLDAAKRILEEINQVKE